MATPDLLGMPREVLDRILRDCLVAGIVAQKDSFPSFAKFEIAVPILRTCKIIYEARLPILYGENIFYFYRFLELKSWLGKQRIYNKGMIKHVLVLHNVGAGNDRVKPWVALPGLRSYNILEPGLSHEPEMPGLTFMRRMWRKEQPVDIGVVTLDNGSCPPALNTDLSELEMKLYNVIVKGTHRKELVFEFELDKHYSADKMKYTFLERRRRK